jgi:hypothetical protein
MYTDIYNVSPHRAPYIQIYAHFGYTHLAKKLHLFKKEEDKPFHIEPPFCIFIDINLKQMNKSTLKQLIKEEISKIFEESDLDVYRTDPQERQKHLNSLDRGVKNLLRTVAREIFTLGLEDIEILEINSYDELFTMWSERGNLDQHTQDDIREICKNAGLSEDDIQYVLGLPEVDQLEQG